MKFVLFCAFAATFAALAICAPSLSVSARLLSADEVAMLESDETLSDATLLESDETLSLGNFGLLAFCPKDFKLGVFSSPADLQVIANQWKAFSICGIAKAKASLELTKYNHVEGLFKQNTQQKTWKTQADVNAQKQNLDNAKKEESKLCLCKDGKTTAQQEEAIAATQAASAPTTSAFPSNGADYSYGRRDIEFCPADFSTSGMSHSQGNTIRSRQRSANSACLAAYSGAKTAQGTYNQAVRDLSAPNPHNRPSFSRISGNLADFNAKIANLDNVCACSADSKARTKIETEAGAALAAMTAAENAAATEAKNSALAKDAAEAQAQADGYSSVQGKIDAWNKSTAEATAAAQKSASAQAAEAAQIKAQAAADSKAKKDAAAKAYEQAKADAIQKAAAEAKSAAEANAAAQAQAAADKAAADVYRTEIATKTITAEASATVTSVSTATISATVSETATITASGSAAVVKSKGASETASASQSATETKSATSSQTVEQSATEKVTQSATATKTAPGTKVHFSCGSAEAEIKRLQDEVALLKKQLEAVKVQNVEA